MRRASALSRNLVGPVTSLPRLPKLKLGAPIALTGIAPFSGARSLHAHDFDPRRRRRPVPRPHVADQSGVAGATNRFALVRHAALLALVRLDRARALRVARKLADAVIRPKVKSVALSLIGARAP